MAYPKKSPRHMERGGRRGYLMSIEQKNQIIKGVQQACSDGARQRLACDIVGISPKALQRWVKADSLADKRQTVVKYPINKLSELEQARVIAVANSEEFADLPPSQIVPKLADKGVYIASESTMYRVLKANKQLTKRTSSRVYNHPKLTPFVATGPNQIRHMGHYVSADTSEKTLFLLVHGDGYI